MRWKIVPRPFYIESDCDPKKDPHGFNEDMLREVEHGEGMDYEYYPAKEVD